MNTLNKKPGQVGSEDESEFWSQRPPDILFSRSKGTSDLSCTGLFAFRQFFSKTSSNK